MTTKQDYEDYEAAFKFSRQMGSSASFLEIAQSVVEAKKYYGIVEKDNRLMSETLNQQQERILFLREVADYGLRWYMGSRSPSISIPPNAMKDVSAEDVAQYVHEDVLEVRVVDETSTHPFLEYKLTRKGANMVLASFKGFPILLLAEEHLHE